MSILKIKNEKGEWQGVTSIKGEKGDPGVSPDITVAKNDRNTYKLRINTKDRMFTTPNLKGDRAMDIGNTDGELGVIDNWYDWEGHRVTPALSELPQLPRLESFPTRYCFDHDVVMYTMDGEPNEKGICSIEDYTRHEGSVITVPPNGQEYLTDYVIYNARPKFPWDTWEERQLMKRENRKGFPNMAAGWDEDKDRYSYTCPFEPGEWNYVDCFMYDAADIPSVWENGLLYYGRPQGIGPDGIVTEGEEIPNGQVMELDIDVPPLKNLIMTAPRMKNGIWWNFDQNAEGNCCGEEHQWGISKILNHAKAQEGKTKSNPREFGCVLIAGGDIKKANSYDGHNMFKEAEGHRGIVVALKPNVNYTIESLNGPVAILSPNTGMNAYYSHEDITGRSDYYVTKVTQDLFESSVETITVSRREETQIVGSDTVSGTGKVPVGQDKVLGTTLMYYVNDNPAYVGRADVPAICRVPNKVIEKGENFTFRIGEYNPVNVGVTDAGMKWGVYLFCWNEEDYAGIKITEGIEPYSVINAERIAAGATKMKLNVKFGSGDDALVDHDVNYYEYNIRLADTTEDNGYVRYLTNECKKSYDLDEFSLVGHHHELADIDDLQDLVDTIPVVELSTQTIADGVTPLAENHLYLVYEGE
jgi:hypothetical protein